MWPEVLEDDVDTPPPVADVEDVVTPPLVVDVDLDIEKLVVYERDDVV
jgi:hypothetical protein